jgi:hypothetical protein
VVCVFHKASVIVSSTVYIPGSLYSCLGFSSLELLPSHKSQEYIYGHTQPFILGIKVASKPLLISSVSTEAFIEKFPFSLGILIRVVTIF